VFLFNRQKVGGNMIAEPYKIKTVREVKFSSMNDRKKTLKDASFNTFSISSENVTFDMTSHGAAAMSQEQLSGILIGDEAYAGSRNFERLEDNIKTVFGHALVCPTHNLNGSIKLISSTMVNEGDVVFSNSLTPKLLTEDRCAQLVTIDQGSEAVFSGNLDLDQLKSNITGERRTAYIYLESFADGYRPVSLTHLRELSTFCREQGFSLILDASRIIGNALFIRNNEPDHTEKTLHEIVTEMASHAEVCVLDAAEESRCNIGGLISTNNTELHNMYRNEVVVFEGLHTYGGMSGRTMEIFARGLIDMLNEHQAKWMELQINKFSTHLETVPMFIGCDGIYLKADEFLPHINEYQAQTLATALYLKSGVRTFLDGSFHNHNILAVQIPRMALHNQQLYQIAEAINELYSERENIPALHLKNTPKWHDQAHFEWDMPEMKEYTFDCVPHTIHTIECVGVISREDRQEAIKQAGYNTFLLASKDVAIDFLTDSGTSAMSIEQWNCYYQGNETQASSKDYDDLVAALQDLTGYKYIIPTHQGRAAEHIMSQVMIRRGYVPGNMYFTTTKLHQELAGATFVDVIVDEAHQSESDFPWKGNIDVNKIDAIVQRDGAEAIPYISFEMSVNMAGGQPFSMDNAKEIYKYCKKHNIPVMFDATRAVENAYMIQKLDSRYHKTPVKEILKEMFSYGDGCTVSSKKDYLVNIGGFLAIRDDKDLYEKSLDMLRKYEGSVSSGGLSGGDLAVHARGVSEMVDNQYIRSRVEQTQYLGNKLLAAGVPIVQPAGTHAIFLDAKRFLPHIDQDQYPAQALAAAIYVESGVRAMERGNVSKGRDPKTGKNYRPELESVRLTIPRRVYTNDHMDMVADAIINLYKKRDTVKGLSFTYEPEKLRFFQGRFQEVS